MTRIAKVWPWAGWGMAVALAMHGGVGAQTPSTTPATQPAQASTTGATSAVRFMESCNEALERGVAELGCQGPIYRNELERMKREALQTQNPQLLSFVGDAYQNQRSGLGDIGQAYRWYLLAAVRGDPRAMQRLSEMNRKGQGVPKDNVRALGYARLLQRLSQPESATHRNTLTVINELGAEMAVEEVALADRFASEMEARILRQASGEPSNEPARSVIEPGRSSTAVPGLTGMPRTAPQTTVQPGAALQPNVPGLRTTTPP